MPIQLSNSIYLTVLGPPPPQPVLTVPSGVPTAVTEVLQPFQFDNAGRLAATQDPATKLAMHMLDIIFTRKGERVMQPAYGIGAQDYVFEPIDSPLLVGLANDIKEQIGIWEPGANLLSVVPIPTDATAGEIALRISFTVGVVPTQHVVTYNLAGQRVEI